VQLDAGDVVAALADFLASDVLASGARPDDDDVLADLGVDSFALMEVILFVERRFGIVLPMETLTPEHTATVGALGRCVVAAARAG
jgi:acyl carrier protein